MSLSDDEIIKILKNYRNIACVGFSKDPNKWAGFVPRFLISKGYNVIPVNPSASEIDGRRSYPSLLDVPENVEVVQIFRPSEEVPSIVDQAIKRKDVKVIWMQLGIVNNEAAEKAKKHGLIVVQDRCMYEEYMRLMERS